MQGSALIAAVTHVMKMKEFIFQNRLWTAAAMGNHNKPIRQALEEANKDARNALSQIDADSKDHEQDRQTDAAYPVSSFRESV